MFFVSIFLLAIWLVAVFINYWIKQSRLISKFRQRNIPFVNIPGRLMTLLFQNRPELILHDAMKKCGTKIFGIKADDDAVTIVVAVPELVQNVMSKEFTNFVNRRKVQFTGSTAKMLFFLEDDAWKRVRSIVAPTFAAKKLRRMIPQVQETTKTLIKNIESSIEKDDAIDVKRFTGCFTMDTIIKTAFGVQIDSISNPDNPLVNSAREMFDKEIDFKTMCKFIIDFYIPQFRSLRAKVVTSSTIFDEYSTNIVKQKRERFQNSNGNFKAMDFIDLMLEAESDIKAQDQSDGGTDKFQKYITEDEIIAQCLLFFFAGYDTTATTLAMSCYNLATHPEKQEKLYEEIVSVLNQLQAENPDETDPNKLITLESLGKFEYLEAVINETLRLYPVVSAVERRASADCRLETSDGKIRLDVKKDDVINIPIYSLHHDPEQFPEPYEFKPERFLGQPGHHKYSHIPFGNGPRTCVGRSLGLMEAKIALMTMVKLFQIQVNEKTQIPPKFFFKTGLLSPRNIMLKFEKRF